MGALMDLFRVLFEPTAVFERVRERPRWLVPAILVGVLATILNYLFLPFRLASMAPQMAQAAARSPEAPAQMAKFTQLSVYASPIFVVLFVLIVAGVLWLLVMLMAGGEAKYRLLLSVATYTALPSILLQGAMLVVLKMKGVESVSSPLDLQPPLGLNLVAPGVTGFVAGVLAGINPFAIWSMVLRAIGIRVTHKTSNASAYAVSLAVMLIGLILGGVGAALASKGAS